MIETIRVGRAAPDIVLTSADHDRLLDLATAALPRLPDIASLLLDELDRATIAPINGTASNAAGIHSYVRFHDSETGETQDVQIVYPHEADITLWKISVLTLIGAGLIGLSAGQSIAWPTRDGRKRTLNVLAVSSSPFKPERAKP